MCNDLLISPFAENSDSDPRVDAKKFSFKRDNSSNEVVGIRYSECLIDFQHFESIIGI